MTTSTLTDLLARARKAPYSIALESRELIALIESHERLRKVAEFVKAHECPDPCPQCHKTVANALAECPAP